MMRFQRNRQNASKPHASVPVPDFDYLSTFKVPAPDTTGTASRVRSGGTSIAEQVMQRGHAQIVVVGNGIAGCAAAMEARQYAPDAEIVIVTEQSHPTINTPALKQFGAGYLELAQLLAQPPDTERRLGIGVIHEHVEQLDARTRRVMLLSGQQITYDRLLLATGSRPVGLGALPGADFDGVMTLHTLSQYLDLRRRLPGVSRAIVIGGGYHAAESALLLRHAGIATTLLVRGRCLVSSLLDLPAADLLRQHLQRQGVEVRLETEVAGVVGRMGVAAGVLTTEGAFLPGQLIIVAIGVQPDVRLARGGGMGADIGKGVRAYRQMQTEVASVYAAGAVARVRDPQTGGWESRAQWYFAFQQGRLAGAALAGARIPAGSESGAMGAFWHATQFGKLSILAAGAPTLSDREHRDYEVLTNGSASFYRRLVLRDHRVVGYLAVGANPPAGLAIKRIIDEQMDVREVTRQLLGESFDARAFFTRQQLNVLQTGGSAAHMSAPAGPHQQRPSRSA